MFKIIFSQLQIFLKMEYYEILSHKSYLYALHTKRIMNLQIQSFIVAGTVLGTTDRESTRHTIPILTKLLLHNDYR